MEIIDELLSPLDYKASTRDVRQGPFQTAVLTRHCGLREQGFVSEFRAAKGGWRLSEAKPQDRVLLGLRFAQPPATPARVCDGA